MNATTPNSLQSANRGGLLAALPSRMHVRLRSSAVPSVWRARIAAGPKR